MREKTMSEIKKLHTIEIYINGNKADVYSQDKLNLRFNNQFTDPSEIKTISAEYSFSFSLPQTPTNNKIFGFANEISVKGKFGKQFPTYLNVDGLAIFNGELILTSYSKEEGYRCNLYVNRLNTVEKIFGESTLNEINNWTIPYDQEKTINEWNDKEDIKYPQDIFFPLVSYGMFQKIPQQNGEYTSKFLIDDYSRIYNENFYPSHNLLSVVRKCFESKGYDVQGDIFDDEAMKHIYMSTCLGDKQEPHYNYGKPEMGKVDMKFNYQTAVKVGNDIELDGEIRADLPEPMFSVGKGEDGVEVFNYETNNVYNIFTSTDKFFQPTFLNKNDIMWRKNRIVIPATGYYKIHLKYNMSIKQGDYRFPRYMYFRGGPGGRVGVVTRKEILPDTIWNFNEFFTELQLIKNSEDGLDARLIAPQAMGVNGWKDEATLIPKYAQYSAYPHEAPGRSNLSTDEDKYPGGFVPQWDNGTLAYDPSVNKNFVVGCCAVGPYRFNSVIKNGKSWNPECTDTNKSLFTSKPYYGIKVVKRDKPSTDRDRRWTDLVPEVSDPPFGVSTLKFSKMENKSLFPNGIESFQGTLEAIVHLNRNDYLQLKLLCRRFINKDEVDADEKYEKPGSRPGHYRGTTDYPTNAAIELKDCELTVEAFSPDDIEITDKYMSWDNPSRFDKDLNLANFLSNKEKMSDFINNFIKEFNLSYSQEGKTITLNKQKLNLGNIRNVVKLEDRVAKSDITSEYIDLPSSLSVQYTIDESERGFYISAERNATNEQMQSNSWKDYADRGYDKVKVTDDEFGKESSIQTKTSYNWYEEFRITMQGQDTKKMLPIIAKDEWMIEHYNYEEMLKKDGFGLHRRYWFPNPHPTKDFVILNNNPERKVFICDTKNTYDNMEMSYHLKPKDETAKETLLTNYFNVFIDSTNNYVTFDAYLTTEEYLSLKNGAYVSVENDLYIVIKIDGYDVSGNNKASIVAMKF